jgi:hypothetical protein
MVKCFGGLNKRNMLHNRRYIILSISVLNQVDWTRLITLEGQQRLSLDGTKFLVEYDLPSQPSINQHSIQNFTSNNWNEFLDNSEWDDKYI